MKKEELEVKFSIYFLLEAIASALKLHKNSKIYHRAVDRVPRSGSSEDLYDMYGLSAPFIVEKLKSILKENQNN